MADRAQWGWLPWIPYPAVMILGFVLFAALPRSGAPLVVSTYVPVLVTAALVTWLEWVFPYRLEWRPELASRRPSPDHRSGADPS